MCPRSFAWFETNISLLQQVSYFSFHIYFEKCEAIIAVLWRLLSSGIYDVTTSLSLMQFFGFPLCVLESCILLGTWIPLYWSCYFCCHHLWVATMLVWFTKTCNLLFSTVDAYMLKCCVKWNSHSISSKVCGGVKFLCATKPLQLYGPLYLESMMWLLCYVSRVMEICNSYLPWAL